MKVIKSNQALLTRYKSIFQSSLLYSGESIEIKKQEYENGDILIKSKDMVYRIASDQDLRNEYKEYLDLKSFDIPQIPQEIWIDVMEDLHLKPGFIENFVSKLHNKEDYEKLNVALNLSKSAGNSSFIFWVTIYNLSNEYDLYFSGMEAAIELLPKETLLDEIIELITDEGDEFLNQMRNGTYMNFEEGGKRYHIYNVDPGIW